jgi:hypothetical protein
MVLAGLFVTGFALARFLKASPPEEEGGYGAVGRGGDGEAEWPTGSQTNW